MCDTLHEKISDKKHDTCKFGYTYENIDCCEMHEIRSTPNSFDSRVDCADCKSYSKKAGMEFPLTINAIEMDSLNHSGTPELCVVRLLDTDTKKSEKCYGIMLGEFPRMSYSLFVKSKKTLKFSTISNPCIYIPKYKRIIWGDETWWTPLETSEITDEIRNELDLAVPFFE